MKLTPPTPFCLAIDTREQKPLKFPDGTPTVTTTCYPADYSLCGFRTRFAVERKGVTCNHGVWTSDLVGTVTELLRWQSGDAKRGSNRFIYELDAMSRIIRAGGVAFVATDRPRAWYAAHAYFGGLRPSALFGAIRSLEASTSVPFLFFDTESDLANHVLGIALEVYKHANGLSKLTIKSGDRAPAPYAKWLRETKI